MPKRVDHHERRTMLADALLRVAARDGLGEVSLRHVAAEAGVTAGMVQHYFRTKDEMMTFALDAVRDRVERRFAADGPPADAGPLGRVRALLVQLLPLDEERTREAHVGLAYQAHAAVAPALAERLRGETAAMRARFAEEIRAARGEGGRSDPVLAGAAVLSLVEGLVLHVLGGHLTTEQALAVLDDHLGLVLGAP